MTDKTGSPRTFPNPSLPRGWQGGPFEGLTPPRDPTWYDEQRHADPLRRALDGDWSALEELTVGDAPGQTGFDLASVSGGAGTSARPTERVSGAVLRISSTLSGLVVDALPDTWLNTSRYGPPVDLRGIHVGDPVEAEVESGRDGRRYLRSLRRLGEERGPA